VHVLFNETNSLNENDAQDEDFELGLARIDLLLKYEKDKSPMNRSGPGVISSEGGQGLNQSGGSTVEPSLEQNQSNIPRTDSGTGYKTGPETGSRTGSEIGSTTGLEIGFRVGFEPVSPSIPAREESVSVKPLIP